MKVARQSLLVMGLLRSLIGRARSSASLTALGFMLITVSVVRVGIWSESDADALRTLALDPWSSTALEATEFRARNWLGPLLAWSTRLTSPVAYFTLHLFIAGLTTFVWVAVIRREVREVDRVAVLLALAGVPGLALPFFWVGNDAITLLLLAAVVATRRQPLWTGLTGLLIGLNHFEHGLVALSVLALWYLLGGRGRLQRMIPVATSIFGLVMGRLIQEAAFRRIGVGPIESRLDINLFGRTDFTSIKSVAFLFPIFVWSVLGLGTVILLTASPLRLRLSICLGVVALPSIMAFDQTRVFAITAMPLIVVALLESAETVALWVRRYMRAFVALLVVAPWLWLNSWKISGSVMPYTILWAVDRLLPGFELSTLPR